MGTQQTVSFVFWVKDGEFLFQVQPKKGSAEFGDATYKLAKVDFLQIW